MALSPEGIDAMLSAGLTAEQMGAIIKAELAAASARETANEEARKEKAREGNRERQARWRDRNANNAVTGRDSRDPPPKIYNSTPHQALPADPNGSAAPTRRKPRNRALPVEWQPSDRSEAVRQELGRSVEWMHGTATDMRTWAESKGELRADWDATHAGWMRREAKREGERGGTLGPRGQPPPGRNGAKPSSNGALSRAADILGMSNDQRSDPYRNSDHGPVIDHQSDGRSHGQVYEPSGGQSGRFSPEAYPRLVSAYGR